MEIAVGIVLIVIALFLIIAVLFQSSKNARLSGAIAGSAETFFGKAKGKSIDKKLNTLTVIVSIIFAAAVLVVYAIQPGKAKIDYNYDYLESYIDGVVDGSIDISVSEDEEEEDEHDHEHDHDHESEDDSSADAEK